ncbi:hypothetical protein EYF80_037573 [Liparis tanakae]|uniref:Uncharacterized protein n=1 Tax=Liparis tanakae TaxID=230148 RepID=A0A4Z2GFC5_9TELE|nr:hypothetical protein EYF80_037573 [Liparis tanakae]
MLGLSPVLVSSASTSWYSLVFAFRGNSCRSTWCPLADTALLATTWALNSWWRMETFRLPCCASSASSSCRLVNMSKGVMAPARSACCHSTRPLSSTARLFRFSSRSTWWMISLEDNNTIKRNARRWSRFPQSGPEAHLISASAVRTSLVRPSRWMWSPWSCCPGFRWMLTVRDLCRALSRSMSAGASFLMNGSLMVFCACSATISSRILVLAWLTACRGHRGHRGHRGQGVRGGLSDGFSDWLLTASLSAHRSNAVGSNSSRSRTGPRVVGRRSLAPRRKEVTLETPSARTRSPWV